MDSRIMRHINQISGMIIALFGVGVLTHLAVSQII
jgi:hypothetical protein